jgi:hypothetical protein
MMNKVWQSVAEDKPFATIIVVPAFWVLSRLVFVGIWIILRAWNSSQKF